MKIERVVVGTLKENCYILSINNEVVIIDPGSEIDKICAVLGDRKVLAILITHNHFDHVGCLPYFKNAPVYSIENLKEKEYLIGKFKFNVIYTKGHSDDSISFYFADEYILFSGDFLFFENVGRTDLPTGNDLMMKESIKKIIKYPKNMIIYPGHGIMTNLEHEIENNIYFK